jgi:hypothetical protein
MVLWSAKEGVHDVAEEGVAERGRRVLWSVSLRSTLAQAA